MLNKVIVILFICFKLDYTTSLPDIIRIGTIFLNTNSNNKKNCEEKKIRFHATQGGDESGWREAWDIVAGFVFPEFQLDC